MGVKALNLATQATQMNWPVGGVAAALFNRGMPIQENKACNFLTNVYCENFVIWAHFCATYFLARKINRYLM